MIRATVLVLAMAACAPAGDDGPDVSAPLILSPDAELADDTEDAAAAWSAATGLPIVLGSGGVAVRVEDDLDPCGRTMTLRRESGRLVRIVAIDLRAAPSSDCMARRGTLRHELGHALQQWGSFDAWLQHDGHTPDGLMSTHAGAVQVVDEAAIELVCTVAPCTAFVPEHTG